MNVFVKYPQKALFTAIVTSPYLRSSIHMYLVWHERVLGSTYFPIKTLLYVAVVKR